MEVPGRSEGVLYVASSNYDRRFDVGAVTAVDLSQVGLPAFGAASAAPVDLTDLKISADGIVYTDPFAGQLGTYVTAEGGLRLFVPTREQGDRLFVLESSPTAATLQCANPPADRESSCPGAISLSSIADEETDLPRAPQPYALTVTSDRQVLITHLRTADSPEGSGRERRSYLVKLSADAPELTEDAFVEIGQSPSGAVVTGSRYAYLAGRSPPSAPLVRLVDRQTNRVIDPGLQEVVPLTEARGIGLSADERRLYIIGRSTNTDVLIIVNVAAADSDEPRLSLVRWLPLPGGANEMVVLARPGRGNLVAITSSNAGVVSIYDDDGGGVAVQVPEVGLQPYGIAVSLRGPGARLFVTNFEDGRVTVIDISDLLRPQDARVVAFLGATQTCIINAADPSCGE